MLKILFSFLILISFSALSDSIAYEHILVGANSQTKLFLLKTSLEDTPFVYHLYYLEGKKPKKIIGKFGHEEEDRFKKEKDFFEVKPLQGTRMTTADGSFYSVSGGAKFKFVPEPYQKEKYQVWEITSSGKNQVASNVKYLKDHSGPSTLSIVELFSDLYLIAMDYNRVELVKLDRQK